MSQASSNGAGSPLGVQPFMRPMIQDHLDRNNLKYNVDDDGDFRIDFSTEHGFVITALLLADGTNQDVFVTNIVSNVAVPKTIWPKVIFFCNRWNAETRYPKAYLAIPEDVSALFAGVHLEGQFPLAAGIPQALLDEFITTMLGTGIAFWERVVNENVLQEMSEDEDEPLND
jgi:Putative bacterial sensory transduction regulator